MEALISCWDRDWALGTALAEDVDFQMTLFIVAAIYFSAFGGCFFSLSFFQENISKQILCTKCIYRLKVKAF